MTFFDYDGTPYPIREDIAPAYRAYWAKLARPGSWWTGAERVAIAKESRNAPACRLCAARKEALSPAAVTGQHDCGEGLPETAVDAVHRVVTDQARITRKYVEDSVAAGLGKEAYVELVGIVVAVFSIDEFHRALGLDLERLPAAEPGEISRYRPAILTEDMGFVPTVPPEGAVGEEADLWPGGQTANVIRALSLVPHALREYKGIFSVQYLPLGGMRNFDVIEGRAINRMQIELIAGRVSAVNECFY